MDDVFRVMEDQLRIAEDIFPKTSDVLRKAEDILRRVEDVLRPRNIASVPWGIASVWWNVASECQETATLRRKAFSQFLAMSFAYKNIKKSLLLKKLAGIFFSRSTRRDSRRSGGSAV
jgi:hypothetical protein